MSGKKIISAIGIIIVILVAGFLIFLIYWDSITERLKKELPEKETNIIPPEVLEKYRDGKNELPVISPEILEKYSDGKNELPVISPEVLEKYKDGKSTPPQF